MERVFPDHRRHVPSVPQLGPPELKTLRQLFDSHGFASESTARRNDQPDALMTLFARGLSVSREQARETFHPLDVNRLIESGLLVEEQGEIKARFQAQPHDGLILFSDFFRWESDRNFVLPIGPAGNYLALLTIRRQVQATLDLGCGCGIQSLLAARHSDKVIATDINPRALALTRLNAELNGIHNIETRAGSYFEPVQGQHFDLILANLPYVITPERHLIYRTADRPGDAGTHARLRETPAYLKEGGFAQILINWVHGRNQNPLEPIRRTVENKEVDAWLIHNGSKQLDQYMQMWLKNQTQSEPRKLQRMRQSWLNWYRRHHIERIALGAITLRHRSGNRNWFCSATVHQTLEDPAGEQFLRLFAAQDELGGMQNPETLLRATLAAFDLDFVEDEKGISAFSAHESRFEVRISAAARTALQKLDGQTMLEEAIRSASRKLGLPTEQIRDEVLADVRELLKLGMLAPRAAGPRQMPLSAN